MYPVSPLTENPLAPDVQKDSYEYGLKVIRQCYARWQNGYGGETYADRLLRYEKSYLYAMGQQPEDQYRDQIKIEGQKVIVNLDYSALAIATPLLNAKMDRYLERIEKIKCRASGQLATDKKKKQKDEARFKMNYRPKLQELQQASGLQLEHFSDHDPKSERELDVHFNTKLLREEVIMQKSENFVFEQNDWDDVIKKRLIWDTMCAGWCVALTEVNGNGWIKTPVVKPADFITSYSELDNFEDWQWQGQRRSLSISEVRLRTDGQKKPDGSPIITEEQLWQLARDFSSKYGNTNDWFCDWSAEFYTAIARPYDTVSVELVDLYYKTLYNLNYRSQPVGFGREKIYDIKPGDKLPPNAKVEKSKPYYVAYHGVWIIDSAYVLEWGLAKDMLKPNNNLVEIRSPYTIHMHNNHHCRNKSLVETMMPLIDLIQNIHIKSQGIIAMIAPDGFTIDMLGLSNIDMGQGVGVVSPMQLFGIALQTGNWYFMGEDVEGDGRRQEPPIKPNVGQASQKLKELDEQFWTTYKKLQIITGDNNLASGNITNQATANSTLNDAREIAAEPSNFVYKTVLNVKKGVAKNIELLLLDKFFLKDDSFDGYNMALGEDDIEYMRSLGDDIGQIIFDTKIDVVLDSSEQEKWDRRIEIALEQGQIGLEAVAELALIDDPTLRSFMLAQYAKQKKADDAEQAKANTQNNLEQAKAAAESKAKGDMALEQQQHQNKLDQMKEEQNGTMLKQNSEFLGIAKAKVMEAIIAKPDAKLSDIPSFFWDGLGITQEAQKQAVIGFLNAQAKQKQDEQQQAMGQQAQAPQQQGQPQQGQQAA